MDSGGDGGGGIFSSPYPTTAEVFRCHPLCTNTLADLAIYPITQNHFFRKNRVSWVYITQRSDHLRCSPHCFGTYYRLTFVSTLFLRKRKTHNGHMRPPSFFPCRQQERLKCHPAHNQCVDTPSCRGRCSVLQQRSTVLAFIRALVPQQHWCDTMAWCLALLEPDRAPSSAS